MGSACNGARSATILPGTQAFLRGRAYGEATSTDGRRIARMGISIAPSWQAYCRHGIGLAGLAMSTFGKLDPVNFKDRASQSDLGAAVEE